MPRGARPEPPWSPGASGAPLRLLLVAPGQDAAAWITAVEDAGFELVASSVAGVAAARSALRDPVDAVVAWDDEAGHRAAAAVAAVAEEGAAVPVVVVAHPAAEEGLLAALDAGAAAALESDRPRRLPAELARLLETVWLDTRLALTARVAHDLNNLLAPIPLAVQLLRRTTEPSAVTGQLESVDAATRRSMDAVKELSELLAADAAAPLRVRAKHLLTLASRTWRRLPDGAPTVLTEYPTELGFVRVNVVRALQVLWCFGRRALDAGGEGDGSAGELLLTGRRVEGPAAKGGPGVELRAVWARTGSPEGRGDADPVREPEPGDRLDALVEVAAVEGGSVAVLEAGTGRAGFALLLPAVHAGRDGGRPSPGRTAAKHRSPGADRPPGRSSRGSPGAALLIEGDEQVRKMTRATLESAGWRVLTAGDGTEGVAVFAENLGSIVVVLVDLSLPYMNGLATIKALRRIGDEVRIVLTTCNEGEPQLPKGYAGIPDAMLRKPYDEETLLQALGGPDREPA